jgi:hypothetical protein
MVSPRRPFEGLRLFPVAGEIGLLNPVLGPVDAQVSRVVNELWRGPTLPAVELTPADAGMLATFARRSAVCASRLDDAALLPAAVRAAAMCRRFTGYPRPSGEGLPMLLAHVAGRLAITPEDLASWIAADPDCSSKTLLEARSHSRSVARRAAGGPPCCPWVEVACNGGVGFFHGYPEMPRPSESLLHAALGVVEVIERLGFTGEVMGGAIPPLWFRDYDAAVAACRSATEQFAIDFRRYVPAEDPDVGMRWDYRWITAWCAEFPDPGLAAVLAALSPPAPPPAPRRFSWTTVMRLAGGESRGGRGPAAGVAARHLFVLLAAPVMPGSNHAPAIDAQAMGALLGTIAAEVERRLQAAPV